MALLGGLTVCGCGLVVERVLPTAGRQKVERRERARTPSRVADLRSASKARLKCFYCTALLCNILWSLGGRGPDLMRSDLVEDTRRDRDASARPRAPTLVTFDTRGGKLVFRSPPHPPRSSSTAKLIHREAHGGSRGRLPHETLRRQRGHAGICVCRLHWFVNRGELAALTARWAARRWWWRLATEWCPPEGQGPRRARNQVAW
jgi:hypothetical protein